MSADQLAAHALDLFAGLGPGVVARRMFGGLGFYAGGLFFGIGDPEDGRLYLKVDDLTRAAFEAAGGTAFVYRGPRGEEMSMSYLSPPDGALDDAEEMLTWARLAVEAARRAAAAKAARRGPKASTKRPARAARAPAGRAAKAKGPARAGRARPAAKAMPVRTSRRSPSRRR
jgi:DNA transformation protein and related proteins